MDPLKTVKDVLYSIVHPLESVTFLRTQLSDLFFHGGAQIVTCFQCVQGEQSEEYAFRTVVQMDADVINFVPDPRQFLGSADGAVVFADAYGRHQKNVGQFTERLDRFRSVLWAASILASSPVLLLPKEIFPETAQEAGRWLIPLLWPVGSFLVKRYAMPTLLRLLARGVFFEVKKKMTGSLNLRG